MSTTQEATGLRVEVQSRFDPAAPTRVFNLEGSFDKRERRIIESLLADPIIDNFSLNVPLQKPEEGSVVIEVSPKPGVTDPEGNVLHKKLEELLGRGVGRVSCARQYVMKEEDAIQRRDLGNPLISDFRVVSATDWNSQIGIGFYLPNTTLHFVAPFEYVDIEVTDDKLLDLSKRRMLALNLDEMSAIRNLFRDEKYLEARRSVGLDVKPTDAEIEELAQTWSEHCKHKKFNAVWNYTSEDPHDEAGLPAVTDSIFKSIIQAATYRIAENIDWLVSVFKDNSGVIRLTSSRLNNLEQEEHEIPISYNISHKAETHNHPSSLDPFGGAGTGSGGVYRDPRCTGTGMRVVSSQYAFRVPHPESFSDLPLDMRSPKQLLEGIIAGVEDYGNKMGIATGLGSVIFDDGWLKPAVYVGAVAVAPSQINERKTHEKEVLAGYIAVSLGGRVGKDGIHGATASSVETSSQAATSLQINQSVQIGDPIVQKRVFEVMDILQLEGLIEAAQDCGAGGWNSAIGELAEMSNGVVMDLTHAPAKYSGLTGWEKLISESQERCVIVIKPESLARVEELCRHYGVESTNIATFNNSGYYHVKDQDTTIVYLPMEFRVQGLPQMQINAHWVVPSLEEPSLPSYSDLTEIFLALIGRANLQSTEWISTRYDHEVQIESLLKPLVGKGRGRSDAIAYKPIFTESEVVIESSGSNPFQGEIDAYHMGRNAVVDAIGRTIAAGGNLEKIVFNGNTTCPAPEKDKTVAAKVIRMLKGASDAELVFGTPTISGKDSTSMSKSYTSTETGEEKRVSALTELLMSSLCVIPDERTITSPDFKLAGDVIYVIGETKDELGASEFYLMHNEMGKNVPKANLHDLKNRYEMLSCVIKDGLVNSAQYVAKGGLGVALMNSSLAGDLGVDVDLECINDSVDDAAKLLFSESVGRFVVSVPFAKKEAFETAMRDTYCVEIGNVVSNSSFRVSYCGDSLISTNVDVMRQKNKGDIFV